MSQPQFMDDVAKATGLTRAQVKKVITTIGDLTVEALEKGENFKIPNYATVRIHTKAARPECVKKVFGKELKLAARDKISSVKIAPLKKLKDMRLMNRATKGAFRRAGVPHNHL